jgi:hypothetical protein
MYNEDEAELKQTLTGVLHNYNELRADPTVPFMKHDFVVFLIADGYAGLTENFKKYATDMGFYDEEILKEGGFMEDDRNGKWKMKDMTVIMDKSAKKVPLNIIHMF